MDIDMAISKIPRQLQNMAFGFVKLKPKSKIPFEKNWQNRPYSFQEIQEWFNGGGNYGVLGGRGRLIIIDADTEEIAELVRQKLPATFTVKTPGQGYHFYYLCPAIGKKVVLKKRSKHHGEIISNGSQVVGPGSIHPVTGTKYTIENDIEIAEVDRESVYSPLLEYIPIDYPERDKEIEISDLKITAILEKYGITLKAVGDQLVGSHPIHGSATGHNFVVDSGKNVWHCFRDGSGGGPVLLIAVLERVIDCAEAVQGALRGDKFKKVLTVAEEKFGYKPKSLRSNDGNLLIDDQLSQVKNRIVTIPAETLKEELPIKLDYILREMAGMNPVQSDAILRHTIKTHFKLTNPEIDQYSKVLNNYRQAEQAPDNKKRLSEQELIKKLDEEESFFKIHPAQDYADGKMFYSTKIDDKSYLITSENRLIAFEDAAEEGYILKYENIEPARISPEGIKSVIRCDYAVDIPSLFNKIRAYLKRYIVFPDEAHSIYLALWATGTYVFTIFNHYPYVWINAEKRSGKTLLMQILSEIAFNGEMSTNPTEAVIFRNTASNLPTMFIDEVENLRKNDKDTYGALMRVLNSGSNKVGKVDRLETDGKGKFKLCKYPTYCPKMFAGINEIDDVLQDRAVCIQLLRKLDSDLVQRYKGDEETRKLQQEIRDGLYFFGLFYSGTIALMYNVNNVPKGAEHLGDRDLDIWEPIFLLAEMIDENLEKSELTEKMIALSKQSSDQKQADSVDQNETYKLLTVVKEMFQEINPVETDGGIQYFKAEDVYGYFKAQDEYEWLSSKNTLTSRLKKIKVRSEQKRVESSRIRVYRVNISQFDDLCERFKIK